MFGEIFKIRSIFRDNIRSSKKENVLGEAKPGGFQAEGFPLFSGQIQ